MKSSRRDLFKFLGGSAVGAVFTPVPWRLITDTALWSENWPGIPRPARGEIRAKFTNCALCPAGCAVRARCVGEQPVALAGVRGGLCAFGVTGHHLPYHPQRLKQGPAREAGAAVADALGRRSAQERIAVLDLRPGRTASWTYRRAMAAIRNGAYLAPPEPPVRFNLAAAKTVLSLGAPLLDGWGTPTNVLAAREHFRLIQADALESHTADLADLWLPIQPGSEEALALAITGVLKPGEGMEAAEGARITGLSEEQIRSLAREVTANGPALVLDREGSPAIIALNLLLGGWGRTVVARREPPVPQAWKNAAGTTELDALPDGSVSVLLIDESAPGRYLPWGAIEKKLVPDNPLVVAFTCWRSGYGRYAKYVLPTAVYPETLEDIPAADDTLGAGFRLSAPLVTPPEGMVNPAEFIASLAGLASGNALRERSDAIHKTGRGMLVTYADGKTAPVKELKADEFWKGVSEGGCWTDDAVENTPPPKVTPKRPATRATEASDLPLVAAISERMGAAAPVSPVMSKLYQESNLRLGANRAALHPETARAAGVADGQRARLQTADGTCAIEITVDASVPPGTVEVAGRPEVLDVCAPGARAKVVRA